ncbi:MAG: D-alanyl-D-alanine carboxypeptidase [Candidatus Binatia bacterium]|nr:D-alanyl-D-alanine carboxypeptidase [Candidatus Binatia bacterium]
MRKKKSIIVLTLAAGCMVLPLLAQAAPVARVTSLTARSAIVMDAESGAVLWSHNPDEPLPPASTTKVVTALLALQSGRLTEPFVVSNTAAQAPPSKIGLRPGMTLRLRDLVYAVMLNSANDASIVIAEGLAGSVPAFARQMNALARRLGAERTNFVNPNGLPADDHYSTARDLATIFRYAIRHPVFMEVVSTRSGQIRPESGGTRPIALRNHNRLLGEYPIEVVGKTGYTRAAKRCFVGAAQWNGQRVTFAVLGATDLWGDIKKLLAAVFEHDPWPQVHPRALQTAQTGAEAVDGGDEADQPGVRGRYAVRLGSFRNYDAARKVSASLKQRGYSVRLERRRRKRGALYQVTVGGFADPREAHKVAQDLRRSHHRVGVAVVQR